MNYFRFILILILGVLMEIGCATSKPPIQFTVEGFLTTGDSL